MYPVDFYNYRPPKQLLVIKHNAAIIMISIKLSMNNNDACTGWPGNKSAKN